MKEGHLRMKDSNFRPGGRDYIYVNDEKILKINQAYIENLKEKAHQGNQPRLTMCLHNDIRENVHEMIQVFKKHEYVRPHYHPEKTETKIVLEGKLLVVIYDMAGKKMQQFVMSRDERNVLIFRMDRGVVHTNIPLTDVVFQEIITGPYRGKDDSVFPEWTCDNHDAEGVRRYLNDLLLVQ